MKLDLDPDFIPETLAIRLFRGAPDAFDIDSEYVESFWTPILGPTSILLLRSLTRIPLQLDSPTHAPISMALLSEMLGLQLTKGRNSSIVRTIERLCLFSIFELEDTTSDTITVAIPNTIRQVDLHRRKRWSETMTAAHQIAINAHLRQHCPPPAVMS